MDWDLLVHERNVWVEHNFPDSPSPDGSILGIIEELGELCHAALKAGQGIRGSKEQHIEDAKDAIGDLTVYLLGVMNFVGKTPSAAVPPLRISDPCWCLKTLAHEVGLVAINPTIYGCERIIHCLKVYCGYWAWDYELIVLNTWAEVKQRDWIKYPDTGLPPGETLSEAADTGGLKGIR